MASVQRTEAEGPAMCAGSKHSPTPGSECLNPAHTREPSAPVRSMSHRGVLPPPPVVQIVTGVAPAIQRAFKRPFQDSTKGA